MEQIQVKYDTRLLLQQMFPADNLKASSNHVTNTLLDDCGSHRYTLEMRKLNDDASMYEFKVKLKSIDGAVDDNVPSIQRVVR